jgi:hypothetical protein
MLTAQKAAETLNRCLKNDPAVISTLFQLRRTCSKAIADDPYVIVGAIGEGEQQRFILGLLGLLNGMLVEAGSPDVVGIKIDDEHNQNILGFIVHPKDPSHGTNV